MVDFTLKTTLDKRLDTIKDKDISGWPLEIRCFIHDLLIESQILREHPQGSMLRFYTVIKKLEDVLETQGDENKFTSLLKEGQ